MNSDASRGSYEKFFLLSFPEFDVNFILTKYGEILVKYSLLITHAGMRFEFDTSNTALQHCCYIAVLFQHLNPVLR